MKIKLPKPNRLFRRKEIACLHIMIGYLEIECDQLAYAYNDLMSWGELLNLKGSELSMIKDALENRLFTQTIYEFCIRIGYRQTYKGLMEKIKKEIKRREMI